MSRFGHSWLIEGDPLEHGAPAARVAAAGA
jgi:hypothetical protein